MPPLHQTSSHYVLENVAERAQTVCERSGRSSNCLRSFYELHGRAQTGMVLQNFEPTQSRIYDIIWPKLHVLPPAQPVLRFFLGRGRTF